MFENSKRAEQDERSVRLEPLQITHEALERNRIIIVYLKNGDSNTKDNLDQEEVLTREEGSCARE
jgi:hypothetical protein